MTALSKFGPALHVALSAVSFITVALPIRSLSPPHSHPNPVICRLLVILVATCIGVSGLMRLASDNNSTIFASRVVELVGQSTATFTTMRLFFESCSSLNQHDDPLTPPSSSAAALTARSFLPSQRSNNNNNISRSKIRFSRWWTTFPVVAFSSRVPRVILFAVFVMATLLSFICILPLGIYSIDNGALSNTWLSPYVGPLLEFLLALALFISILFLNINLTTTAPSIFRRQYDRTRAPTHIFNLTVTAAGRGPAILLVVQFFALITYAFTLGVTSATSHNGTRSDLRVAISLRTVGLHTVYDVLIAFWITSWVVLLYYIRVRSDLVFFDSSAGASSRIYESGAQMISAHESGPTTGTGGNGLLSSSFYRQSKTQTQTIMAFREDPFLATTTITLPYSPTSPTSFELHHHSIPRTSTSSAIPLVPHVQASTVLLESGSKLRRKERDGDEDLVTVQLGDDDDDDEDKYSSTSSSFIQPHPTANTAFSPTSLPSPFRPVAGSPSSFPLLTEPHAPHTSVTSNNKALKKGPRSRSQSLSLSLSSLLSPPTSIPAALLRRQERRASRRAQVSVAGVQMQDFVLDLEGSNPSSPNASLFTPAHASGIGAPSEHPSRPPSSPVLDRRASSVTFVDEAKPGLTGKIGTGEHGQEHESPLLPKLASESERERVESLLGPSGSSRMSRLSSGTSGWTRWKEKIVKESIWRTKVLVDKEKEKESAKGFTMGPPRASDALNMLEGVSTRSSAVPKEGHPAPAPAYSLSQSPPPSPLFRHQVQRHASSSRSPLAQSQTESDYDPVNHISAEAALDLILERHKHSSDVVKDRIHPTSLNLDPISVALEHATSKHSQSQPQSANGYKQRTILPLSPSEEFLADLQGDPFASAPSTPRLARSISGTIRSGGGGEYAGSGTYTLPSTPCSPTFPPSFVGPTSPLALPPPMPVPVSALRRLSSSDVSGDSATLIRSAAASVTDISLRATTAPSTPADEAVVAAGKSSVGLGLGLGLALGPDSSSTSPPRFPLSRLNLSIGVQRPRSASASKKGGYRRPSTASASVTIERVHDVFTSSSSPQPPPGIRTRPTTAPSTPDRHRSRDRDRDASQMTESPLRKMEKPASSPVIIMTMARRNGTDVGNGNGTGALVRRTVSDPRGLGRSGSQFESRPRSRTGSSPPDRAGNHGAGDDTGDGSRSAPGSSVRWPTKHSSYIQTPSRAHAPIASHARSSSLGLVAPTGSFGINMGKVTGGSRRSSVNSMLRRQRPSNGPDDFKLLETVIRTSLGVSPPTCHGHVALAPVVGTGDGDGDGSGVETGGRREQARPGTSPLGSAQLGHAHGGSSTTATLLSIRASPPALGRDRAPPSRSGSLTPTPRSVSGATSPSPSPAHPLSRSTVGFNSVEESGLGASPSVPAGERLSLDAGADALLLDAPLGALERRGHGRRASSPFPLSHGVKAPPDSVASETLVTARGVNVVDAEPRPPGLGRVVPPSDSGTLRNEATVGATGEAHLSPRGNDEGIASASARGAVDTHKHVTAPRHTATKIISGVATPNPSPPRSRSRPMSPPSPLSPLPSNSPVRDRVGGNRTPFRLRPSLSLTLDRAKMASSVAGPHLVVDSGNDTASIRSPRSFFLPLDSRSSSEESSSCASTSASTEVLDRRQTVVGLDISPSELAVDMSQDDDGSHSKYAGHDALPPSMSLPSQFTDDLILSVPDSGLETPTSPFSLQTPQTASTVTSDFYSPSVLTPPLFNTENPPLSPITGLAMAIREEEREQASDSPVIHPSSSLFSPQNDRERKSRTPVLGANLSSRSPPQPRARFGNASSRQASDTSQKSLGTDDYPLSSRDTPTVDMGEFGIRSPDGEDGPFSRNSSAHTRDPEGIIYSGPTERNKSLDFDFVFEALGLNFEGDS